MSKYIAKRLMLAIPVWFLISIFAFSLSHLARSSPAAVLLGGTDVPESAIQQMNRQLGLDRPLLAQYISWLGGAVHGNLGTSYFLHTPVTSALWSHGIVTASIAAPAVLLAVCLGVLGGVISAVRPNSKTDAAATIFTTLGMSIPEFWMGMLLILAFSVSIHLFPPLGYVYPWQSPLGWAHDAALPAIAIGLIQAAPIARMCRASMLENLSAQFIRTARMKGIPERRVIFVHALRAAMLPVLTSIGLVVMLALAGDFVIEIVFNIPGLGYLMVNSALESDYPVIEGGVLLIGTVVILVNLAVDVAYAWANPQVRNG